MDGPHGLCLITFNAVDGRYKIVPPFEVHEHMRNFVEEEAEGLFYIYTTDRYTGDRRSVLVTAMYEYTTEEELTAAKQWLLDITYLRYAELAGSQ